MKKKCSAIQSCIFRSDFLQNPYFNKQNGKRGNDLDQFQNGFDNSDEVNDGYRNGIHDADDEKLPLQNSYHQDEPTVTQLCYNPELNSKRPASQILMDDMKETERKNPKNRTTASEKVSLNFVQEISSKLHMYGRRLRYLCNMYVHSVSVYKKRHMYT